MSQTTLFVSNERNDFQAALSEGGCVDLMVTGRGRFRARLSRIELSRMHLTAGEEHQPRVAFVSLPSHLARVTLPTGPDGSMTCGGVPVQVREIVTHSAGACFHERTNGRCRWGTISFPTSDLVAAVRAMHENKFVLPPGGCRWQPPARALRSLVGLHRDAIRATNANPDLLVEDTAAHGLEQQLMGALLECLAGGEPIDQGSPSQRQHAEIMIGFEDIIRASRFGALAIHDISAALGISEATLRTCCREHLGMGPSRYLYLRRMHLANRALRDADSMEAGATHLVRLYGFDNRGGFQTAYRELFSELPLTTLRRRTMQ